MLIANPSASPATVRATFLRANGQPPVVKTWDVLPTSRFNIWVNAMVPELQNEDFGVLVDVLNGVERRRRTRPVLEVGGRGVRRRDQCDGGAGALRRPDNLKC